jgi:hypothetical protein
MISQISTDWSLQTKLRVPAASAVLDAQLVGAPQDVVSYQDYARRARKCSEYTCECRCLRQRTDVAPVTVCVLCTGLGARGWWKRKEGFEKEKVFVLRVAVGRVIGT